MDLEDLGSKLGLDKNEFRVLAKLFVDKAAIDIQEYRNACQGGDGETAAASAHSLKGSSANLGFSEIHELAKKAEADSKNGNFDEYETVSLIMEEQVEQIKKQLND